MIINAMRFLKDGEGGSAESIMNCMIHLYGKDKVCDLAAQPCVLTFDGHENCQVKKEIAKKIQKVISRHRDTLFSVSPVRYTLKDL